MTKIRDERQGRFVKELGRLERRELADLRRGLGDKNVYWLERLYAITGYGAAGRRTKDTLQLLASLYALKPQANDEVQGDTPETETDTTPKQGVSIGYLMAQVHLEQNRKNGRQPSEPSSTEKRFLGLLDADWEGFPYHMRQAVTLLNAQEQTPDWDELAGDLLSLSYSTDSADRIHKKWAKAFYGEVGKAQATVQKATKKTDAASSEPQTATSTPLFDIPTNDQDDEGDPL